MLAGHFQRHSLKTRVTLFTIAVFIVSLWGLSFMTSRMLHADMQRGLGQQQSSALNLLSQFVNQGLEDRLAALGKVAQQISLAQMKPSADLQNRLNQSVSLQGLFNGGAFVVNPQGQVLADTPGSSAWCGNALGCGSTGCGSSHGSDGGDAGGDGGGDGGGCGGGGD